MIGQSFTKLDNQQGIDAILHSLNDNKLTNQISKFMLVFLSVFAIPARLVLRQNFGERSFSLMSVASCLLIQLYVPVIMFTLVIGSASDLITTDIFIFFAIVVVLANPFLVFLYYQVRVSRRHFKNVMSNLNHPTSYSKYRGDSKLFSMVAYTGKKAKWGFEFNDDYVRMFVEPVRLLKWSALGFLCSIAVFLGMIYGLDKIIEDPSDIAQYCAFIGMMISTGTLVVSLHLVISALCLLIEESSIYFQNRSAALDMLDSQEELKQLQIIQQNMKKAPGVMVSIETDRNEVALPMETLE